LGDAFRDLAMQRVNKIIEGHLIRDHVHMLISILPKYAVSRVVGYIKGKTQSMLQGRMLGAIINSFFKTSGPEDVDA